MEDTIIKNTSTIQEEKQGISTHFFVSSTTTTTASSSSASSSSSSSTLTLSKHNEKDRTFGDIYLITNLKNNKKYVGQANKILTNEKPWGYLGRWDSHIREAKTISKVDHCRFLNNAIRKHGLESFKVELLEECPMEDLDKREIFYISHYESLAPKGYNLTQGGGKNKVESEETKKKRIEAHTGKIHSEDTKSKISKNQIGNRRNAMKRKNPEDNDLPKYINSIRKNGVIIGYSISAFPIGIEKPEYISKRFCSTLISSQENLESALKELEELKKIYKHIEKNIEEQKIENIEKEMKNASTVRKQMFIERKKKKLPDNVEIIEKDNVILGFKIFDPILNEYKEFSDKTERWNLHAVKKYAIHMYRRDEDKSYMSYLDSIEKINQKLPFTLSYINTIIYFDKIVIGFNIEINKTVSENKGLPKIFKSFDDPTKPLLQLFYECIEEYEKIMKKEIKIPTIDCVNESIKKKN